MSENQDMARNYWMFVQTEKNFQITKQMGFTLHGLSSKYRRRADRMEPGDSVLYYVRDTKKWKATATIKSKSFEDRSPLWNPTQRGEDFRYRVEISPNITLEDVDAIDAFMLAPRLEYLKRWTPELWLLAFRDSVHLLPQRDFRLIEGEMKRILVTNAKRKRIGSADPGALPIGTLVRSTELPDGISYWGRESRNRYHTLN